MLADLNLRELPDDALVALRSAINEELNRRIHARDLQRRTKEAARAALRKGARRHKRDRSIPAAFPKEVLREEYPARFIYLRRLLMQDWSALFPQSDRDVLKYYVYAHVDPRTEPVELKSMRVTLKGQPFYIGKGSGQRAWDLKRNQIHGKRIQAVRQCGYAAMDIVQILVEGLTEQQALELEAKLIYFFGSIYNENTTGCLVNLADHILPKFREEMELWLLIRKEVALQLQHERDILTAMFQSR